MKLRILLLLTTVVVPLASCAESAEERRDVDTTVVPLPMQGQRAPGFDPGNVQNFEEVVRRQYAREALQLPRGEMDSILASLRGSDPETIQRAMDKRLKAQDTVARRVLADRYRISLDSINTILARK